ncbi:MAG: hypothetical protein HKN41_07645 [Ilumatobacter sp.]|nr:hypothetical protein [Ilumatobacter sp.]
MADWSRRAEQALRRELRPGEVVLATVMVERGHVVVDPPDDDDEDIGDAGRSSMAGSIDPRTRFLVLTDQRLLVTGARGLTGRPAAVLGLLQPRDLRLLEVERDTDCHVLVAHFTDGSSRRFRAPLRQTDPRAFDRELARRVGSGFGR